MSAARSVGGVIGLLVLIRVGSRATRGSVLMGIDMVLGGALMALALAPTFALALIPLAVVGAAAASCDSLSQSLMQRSTGDAERGAAMGIWAFAVGVGPIGHLAIGAAAQRLGAPATQMLFGGVLVILAGLLLLNPVIRRLR
jgi:sugar phosphate permease